VPDTSQAYHGGNPTLTKTTLTNKSLRASSALIAEARNITSLYDEIILHWTHLATPAQIAQARSQSVNAASYLLQSLACLWSHQLDLIQCTVNHGEYLADSNQARVDGTTSSVEWRRRMNAVTTTMSEMHFLRRHMHHFEAHLALNLERLGVICSGDSLGPTPSLPCALRDAQRDFSQLYNRLQPYVARASALSSIANELGTLHATYKSVQDSEVGLTFSIIAAVVFPATLIASIFSMNEQFLPGQPQFWVFWAVVVPITLVAALLIAYSGSVKRFLEGKASSMQRRKPAKPTRSSPQPAQGLAWVQSFLIDPVRRVFARGEKKVGAMA
jgi:hypothetical protein